MIHHNSNMIVGMARTWHKATGLVYDGFEWSHLMGPLHRALKERAHRNERRRRAAHYRSIYA